MKKYLIILILLIAIPCFGADTKISGLDEDTAPTSDDLVVTVNDPGGSAANKKATIANVMKQYLVPGGTSNIQTWTGNFSFGATLTGNTAVTFPTSGTLMTNTDNTSGTAAGLSGTPALPDGTTGATQSAADKSTKLATTAYVDTPTTQTLTTADSGADADHAVQTVTPTANVTRLTILRTCSDDDGCTDTMAETGAVNGALVTIVNIGTYHCDYATGAGVLNLKNGTPYAMAAGESLTLVYANSQWNEVTRSSATFGPMSAFVLPNSDDPDVAVTGSVSFDTDEWLRVYSTSQKALARVQEEIHVTVYKPNDLADAQRDKFPIWSNESGMSFIITGWKGWSSVDDTTLAIEEYDADGVSNESATETVEIATGSGPYTGSDTTIGNPTIENGHTLWLDFDDTDNPAYVKLTIYGYYAADVD